MGCSGDDAIECMREKPPKLLTATQWLVQAGSSTSVPFPPTIDTKFLTSSPVELLLLRAEFQRKDILLGVNSHEGSTFIIEAFPDTFDPTKEFNENVTSEEYREMVKLLLNTSSDFVIDTVASIYAKSNTDDDGVNYFMALSGMLGDVGFKCPVVNTAKTYATEVIFRRVYFPFSSKQRYASNGQKKPSTCRPNHTEAWKDLARNWLCGGIKL